MLEISEFLEEITGSDKEELFKQFVEFLCGPQRPKARKGNRVSSVKKQIEPERFEARLAEASLGFEEFYEQFALLVQLQERFTAMPMPIRNVWRDALFGRLERLPSTKTITTILSGGIDGLAIFKAAKVLKETPQNLFVSLEKKVDDPSIGDRAYTSALYGEVYETLLT